MEGVMLIKDSSGFEPAARMKGAYMCSNQERDVKKGEKFASITVVPRQAMMERRRKKNIVPRQAS